MSSKKIRLLVVDDEERFLKTLSQRLGLRDFDVTPVTSGPAALELAAEQTFDLALVDLKMPGMSGEKLLEALKRDHPLMEVVILTGHGSIDSAVACTQAGSYSYLQKPAETEALLQVLAEAYQRRVERVLAARNRKLEQAFDASLSESPLAILRRLKELEDKS